MSLSKQKTGTPFLILLFLVVIFLGYWFLRTEGEISKENQTLVNSSKDQNSNTNESLKNNNVNEQQTSKTTTFQNTNYEFQVALLENEVIRETTSEGIYNVYFNNNDIITVMNDDMEGIVRESVGILTEEEVIINGQLGTKIAGASAKDGSAVTIILIKKGGRLYHFQGSDAFLERMSKDFTFTSY